MHLLVTAGPTREFWDPVRFLSNRSSGKMGYAVAAEAARRGHAVTLVSGPTALLAPGGVTLLRVTSAEEMLSAVRAALPACEALVMAAAVADWRPVQCAAVKRKKGGAHPAFELEATPDILKTIKPLKGARTFVGFAAETDHMLEEAARKLAEKGLDLMVANDVTQPDAGFDVDTNRVVLLAPGAPPQPLPLGSKRAVARELLRWIERARGVAVEEPPAELPAAGNARLARQMAFVAEADKLKQIVRRTWLTDGSRYENDAEHSWHLALMAALLSEHAPVQLDLGRVIRMALVHDIVEIDAGDTYCYDERGNVEKPAREQRAAARLFAMLPPDQAVAMRALWDEFEARETPEARFAAALDRLQPIMHNYATGGVAWRDHGVKAAQVRARNRHMEEGAAPLWAFASAMIEDAIRRGWLPE